MMDSNTIYRSLQFNFSGRESRVCICRTIPPLDGITAAYGERSPENTIIICDEHTAWIAEKINRYANVPVLVLPPGEVSKNWDSIERILKKALDTGLGRDGLFVGVGGGVVTDLSAFAASVYMRGAELLLVPCSLLCMADAALGGKTGFDLSGIKNLAGTFYPALDIIMPMEALRTLPPGEWKSGVAELIKTAIIGGRADLLELLAQDRDYLSPGCVRENPEAVASLIAESVHLKGTIVEADPLEKGSRRALLNLGHTFGHALESSLGLGKISHGEAVAWGIARACELGLSLELIDRDMSGRIMQLLQMYGFELRAPYPAMPDPGKFMDALFSDKKKKNGALNFIVPSRDGACIVSSGKIPDHVIREITGNA